MPVTLFTTPNNIKFRFSTFSAAGISLFCIAFFRFHLILAPHSPHSPPHSLHPHSPHSPPHSPQSPFGSSLVDAWSQKSQFGVVRISWTSASSVRVLRVPHTFCKRELDLRFVFVSRLVPALMVVVQHQTEPIDCPWMTVPDKHWHDTLVAVRGSCRLDTNPLRQYLAPRHTSPNAQQHQNDQPP